MAENKKTTFSNIHEPYCSLALSLRNVGVSYLDIIGVTYSLTLHNLFKQKLDIALLKQFFELFDVDDSLLDFIQGNVPASRMSTEDMLVLNEIIKLAIQPDTRKPTGSYYTPFNTAVDVLQHVTSSKNKMPEYILDPAVGGGVFLTAFVKNFVHKTDILSLSDRLYGIDIDATASIASRSSIAFAVNDVQNNNANVDSIIALIDKMKINFRTTDALFSDWGAPDLIVSNPPYVNVRNLQKEDPLLKSKIIENFKSAKQSWDIYMPFLEKGMKSLNANGKMGMLVPIQFLHQKNAMATRQILLEHGNIEHVIDYSNNTKFSKALVKTCAVIATQPAKDTKAPVKAWQNDELGKTNYVGELSNDFIRSCPNISLKLSKFTDEYDMLMSMKSKSHKLAELCYVTFGMRSCSPVKGGGGKDRLVAYEKTENCQPYLEGREVTRYSNPNSSRWIKYIPQEMYSPRRPELFETKKIISRTMLSDKSIVATLDESKHYVEQSLACIVPHGIITEGRSDMPKYPLEYILACMNSKAQQMWFGGAIIDDSLGGGLIHATPGAQQELLIPHCDDTLANQLALDVKIALAENNINKKGQILDNIDSRISKLFGL